MRTPSLLAALLALGCASAPPRPAPAPTPKISPGRPSYEGQSAGIWIWADAQGWHLRTTSAGQLVDYSGVVTPVGGSIEALHPVRPEGYPGLEQTQRGIEFSIPNKGEVEGFDWRSSSGCNRFELRAAGEANPGMVRLGGLAQSPSQLPFELCQ